MTSDQPTAFCHVYRSALLLEPGFSSDLAVYCVASVIANGLCTPLEVVRTRLVLQMSGQTRTSYSGIVDALLTIQREESAAALWKGLYVRLLWNGIALGLVFGVRRYEPNCL